MLQASVFIGIAAKGVSTNTVGTLLLDSGSFSSFNSEKISSEADSSGGSGVLLGRLRERCWLSCVLNC